MNSYYTRVIFHVLVAMVTIAALIPPINGDSRSSHAFPDLTSSPLAYLISDVKSIRLLHACRQQAQQIKEGLPFPPTADIDGGSYGQNNELRDKFMNIIHNAESFGLDSNQNLIDNKFSVFPFDSLNMVKLNSNKEAFEFMEQMCLKYAFDKLRQNQIRQRYLSSKKALEESNDVTRYGGGLFVMFGQNTRNDDKYNKRKSTSKMSPFLGMENLHSAKISHPAHLSYNDGISNPFSNPSVYRDSENDVMGGQMSQPRVDLSDYSLESPSKRGGPVLASLSSQTRDKRRHRLSVNNMLMTLSSMVMEDQAQRNRNNIMRHMRLQG